MCCAVMRFGTGVCRWKEKVADLQAQLNGLRAKLKESEAAIRESKLKDQNIAKLRAEIQQMKTQKVLCCAVLCCAVLLCCVFDDSHIVLWLWVWLTTGDFGQANDREQ
jgi:hypothetical protein